MKNSSPTTWRRVGGGCPEGPARGFSIISVSAAESTAIHASSDQLSDTVPANSAHFLSEETPLSFAKVRSHYLSFSRNFSYYVINYMYFSLDFFSSSLQRRESMFFLPSARSVTGFPQAEREYLCPFSSYLSWF